MTVSPDGASAYYAGGAALAVFDRGPATGALTQKAGTAGCVSQDGTGDGLTEGQCAVGRGLEGVADVVASPDGASVYTARARAAGSRCSIATPRPVRSRRSPARPPA